MNSRLKALLRGLTPPLFADWIAKARTALSAWVAETRLSRDSNTHFTTDYVSCNAESWSRHLAAYRDKPAVSMLEIGSFEGRSALWFLGNILTQPDCRLTCIDPFHRWYEFLFDHNIRRSGAGSRVVKLKGQSEEILPSLQGQMFDIIYVDGSHHSFHVLWDAASCWQLLKPGGILIFDDYYWKPELSPICRPQAAIDLFLDLMRGQYEVLAAGYQVILRRTQGQDAVLTPPAL